MDDNNINKINSHKSRYAGGSGKHRRHGFFYYFVPIVLVVVLVVSGTLFIREWLTYKSAGDEYDQLRKMVTISSDDSGTAGRGLRDGNDVNVSGDGSEEGTDGNTAGNASTEGEGNSSDSSKITGEAPYFPNLEIDYAGLKEMNSDFVGVIYIPALDLVYPVAHSHDNTEYLRRTFEGSTNPSGCIFMDANASGDFSDRNTFIFGHNMKNMTMFGSLKRFLSDDSLCDSDPYIYIYSLEEGTQRTSGSNSEETSEADSKMTSDSEPDETAEADSQRTSDTTTDTADSTTASTVRKYRIFAYFTVPRTDSLYNSFTTDDGYDSYVKKAQSYSAYKNYASAGEEIDFSTYPDLLTLSTCWSNTHTHNFVVVGALVAKR